MSIAHHRTPMRQDKRFLAFLYTQTGIFILLGLHVPVSEGALGALLASVGLFMGVSQFGQTSRFNTTVKAGGADAAPAQPSP